MSAAVAAAAAAALANRRNNSPSATTANKNNYNTNQHYLSYSTRPPRHNRYEMQKRHDWNTFSQYLKSRHHHLHPPPSMRRCSGSHVLDFLKYLDQFGETKVHNISCKYYGETHSTACSCPLKQAWSSLEAVVGRLRVAFEEHGGAPETNPFGSPAVWLYLREVKECQAKARGLGFGC
ncbi:hypothetical protein DCAR_0103329 [Daucus carota subsp. sativus]|uniref:Uncharacterized protein n=1 Tax=Daucus carota subsp. sativus TaxID=79200 RepID=A0A166HWY1_DAUCS|nr:PREDICTED: protein LIGHT-DEPENDENT SHORT HYPOCOTYLS 2-like [Daucus carota subsp. sativus]WOG84148.1 hypothetical protein DCAR_0103329 [Daucus carota subsp. sativus]